VWLGLLLPGSSMAAMKSRETGLRRSLVKGYGYGS
jgi:hypothetical protein